MQFFVSGDMPVVVATWHGVLSFRAVYTGTRPAVSPAIGAGKGWRGRRELAPRCSATRIRCNRDGVIDRDRSLTSCPHHHHAPPRTTTHHHARTTHAPRTTTHHRAPPRTTTAHHHRAPPRTNTHHHAPPERAKQRTPRPLPDQSARFLVTSHHLESFPRCHPFSCGVRSGAHAWCCVCIFGRPMRDSGAGSRSGLFRGIPHQNRSSLGGASARERFLTLFWRGDGLVRCSGTSARRGWAVRKCPRLLAAASCACSPLGSGVSVTHELLPVAPACEGPR